MSILDYLATHPALLAVLWPLLTAAITAAFRPPSSAELLAASGSRLMYLSAWQHALFLLGALGVNSQKVVVFCKALLAPKGRPPPPPPTVPSLHSVTTPLDSSHDVDFDDHEDTGPVKVPTMPPRSTPPAAIVAVSRLAFAAVMSGWIGLGAYVTACGMTTDVAKYSPTPEQELGVISYGTAEEECAYLDASKADRLACVHEVQCSRGRADAATCDAGANVSASSPAVACVTGGGTYACTSNIDCTCTARPDSSADAAPDAPSDGAAAHVILVHETVIRAGGK